MDGSPPRVLRVSSAPSSRPPALGVATCRDHHIQSPPPCSTTGSGDPSNDVVSASTFWGRGPVLPRRMRASSESGDRRSSLLGVRGSRYRRRDPWVDTSPHSPADGAPKQCNNAAHDDLIMVRLSLSKPSVREEDGIAEFEDMMARRVALFQQAHLPEPR
jgi:hypothetical protein